MTLTEIQSNLDIIKSAIDEPIMEGDMEGVCNKLLRLQSFSGLSSECLSQAKRHALNKQGICVEEILNQNITGNGLKMMIESRMAHEISLHLYADRLNSAIVHSLDSLRSVISLYKQEKYSAQISVSQK